MGRDDGMVAILNEHQISIYHSQSIVAGATCVIQALKCVTLGLACSVVIGFVEIRFTWGIVNVVLVGRITRPISTWRVNLADQ